MRDMLLNLFKEISDIPHPSYHEKALSDHIKRLADNLGYYAHQDEHNNLLVRIPASPGYEDAPVVMLQSHLDMVAEKNMESDHDFLNDPLELIIEDNILRANNTTLGADDGVGVVYMMAIMKDKNLKHPELELVFTVEEEVGLVGATNFDTTDMKSTLCIGLDSSGESEVYVSSSGGVRGTLTKPVAIEKLNTDTIKLEIRGLHGGHSGGDIHLERANALKLSGVILKRALDEFDVKLVDLRGGLKINAICREADVEFAVNDKETFIEWFKKVEKELLTQYEISDPGLTFNLMTGKTDQVISEKDTHNIINALFMLPYGVIQKSMAIEDLTITSANIGTAQLIEDKFRIQVSLRATQTFVIENIMAQVSYIAGSTGFELEFSSKYPGWNYEPESKFRNQLFKVYKELRNEEMKEVATHGGVELGIWKGKMPHLDIIGLGPIMHDIHTPKERLEIDSFVRTYEVLYTLLESLQYY